MKKIILMFAFVGFTSLAFAQIKYTGKIETGFELFLSRPVKYDAVEGWQGYQLAKKQNGLDLSMINGVSFSHNLRLGLGLGYLNYEGINGYSVFGDLEYVTTKRKVSPLFNLKVGSSHINNQYENGGTETFVDFAAGVERKISKAVSIQFKAGFRFVHQSIFLPIRLGVRF